MENEIWKEIPGYKGLYENTKSTYFETIIKAWLFVCIIM